MNNQKKKDDIIAKIKKIKNIKIMASIIGSILPFILILSIVIIAAIGDQFPNFVGVTMVGRETFYGSSSKDLPEDLTTLGVDTWSNEEKQIFEDYEREKKYYDGNFTFYNISSTRPIKSNTSEKFDVSTLFSTIHYQGVVNLDVFDIDYSKTAADDLEYNAEDNVINQHTRDFYKQAGHYTGNNFIIYPGTRQLLGYLVANSVQFKTVEYKEWVCGDRICTNADEIYSDWSYLGKITASSRAAARMYYSVDESLEQIEKAIDFGNSMCSSFSYDEWLESTDAESVNDEEWLKSADGLKWLKENVCFDLENLYAELFREKITGSVKTYLENKYSEDEAKVPTEDVTPLEVGKYYIAVSVKKEINYDTYQNYLRKVYVPYIYINCDNCAYKDADDEAKESKAKGITTSIMQFAEAFKYYNQENDLGKLKKSIYPSVSLGGYIGGGIVSGSVPYDYNCSGSLPNELTYEGHSGWDLNVGGNTVGANVYPLFSGVVVTATYSPSYGNCPPSGSNYTCGHCASSYGVPSLGNHVIIYGQAIDGNYYYAKYGHLSGVNVKVGDVVDEKTILGQAGNTGCSSGPHLHIGLADVSGQTVNPYTWKALYGDSYRSVMCSR